MEDAPKDGPFPHVKAAGFDAAGTPLANTGAPTQALGEIAGDFTFFTTALLFTHGFFDRDPIGMWAQAHKDDRSVWPAWVDFRRPFFQDLGAGLLPPGIKQQPSPVNWDHRLYMIADEAWEPLRDFIARMAWTDPKRRQYTKVCYHEVTIVDPTTMATKAFLEELPTIDVTVFAVSTNRYFAYMYPAHDPPRTRPYPVKESPHLDVMREAEAALGPPPDPASVFRGRV